MMKITLLAIIFFTASFLSAQELYTMPVGQQSRLSSFENKNGGKAAGGKTNNGAKGNAFESLKAGESKALLETTGPGIIQRIWITVSDRSFNMIRSLRLRMYWDGNTKSAVDVPLGDFFCAMLGRSVAFESALFSNPEGRSYNCYIPMPFKKGARIVLTNESNTDLEHVFYDIDFITLPKPPADMMYFHACWNREIKSVPGKDFELLPQVKGKGRFLGVNVGVNIDSVYGNTWWGEGEVKMYLDGDSKYPTINGTGAEDYTGTGWGEGVFNHQYQGCLIADDSARQYGFYRFHIPDQIFFYSDVKVTIQKMGGWFGGTVNALKQKGVPLKPVTIADQDSFLRLLEHPENIAEQRFMKSWINFYRVDDYSATAYFYLDIPTGNLPELAPVLQRIQ